MVLDGYSKWVSKIEGKEPQRSKERCSVVINPAILQKVIRGEVPVKYIIDAFSWCKSTSGDEYWNRVFDRFSNSYFLDLPTDIRYKLLDILECSQEEVL